MAYEAFWRSAYSRGGSKSTETLFAPARSSPARSAKRHVTNAECGAPTTSPFTRTVAAPSTPSSSIVDGPASNSASSTAKVREKFHASSATHDHATSLSR